MFIDKRSNQRISLNHPIQISFGTQITLKGQLNDISLKSAFINIRPSVSLRVHDQMNFIIENPGNIKGIIKGSARISRIDAGEGIAIYFVKMDDDSTRLLNRLIGIHL